jgi:hypothetical protein
MALKGSMKVTSCSVDKQITFSKRRKVAILVIKGRVSYFTMC